MLLFESSISLVNMFIGFYYGVIALSVINNLEDVFVTGLLHVIVFLTRF